MSFAKNIKKPIQGQCNQYCVHFIEFSQLCDAFLHVQMVYLINLLLLICLLSRDLYLSKLKNAFKFNSKIWSELKMYLLKKMLSNLSVMSHPYFCQEWVFFVMN